MQNIEIRLITRKFIDFNENECFLMDVFSEIPFLL